MLPLLFLLRQEYDKTRVVSQSQAPDNREPDARALREGEVAAFVKDWGGKNADRIAVHYADDGNLMTRILGR